MPNRGLKGAKAPSQVSKVSRSAITLGNLQSTDKTYEVCALSKLMDCDKRKKEKAGAESRGSTLTACGRATLDAGGGDKL